MIRFYHSFHHRLICHWPRLAFLSTLFIFLVVNPQLIPIPSLELYLELFFGLILLLFLFRYLSRPSLLSLSLIMLQFSFLPHQFVSSIYPDYFLYSIILLSALLLILHLPIDTDQ